MLNSIKVGSFITCKRKELGMTQQQLADKLNISFQAVSKWETGVTFPNIELLYELSRTLEVTIDELLSGNTNDESLSYSTAGVDIAYTDTLKKEMAKYLISDDKRVLNGLGPFASLYDISFPEINEPVLVMKSEEPGSKQKLAMEHGYTESICHDMVNHLVNDIVVMGAKPLAVLDTIVCGNAEKDTIRSIIKGVSEACRENECSLVGGETSIQPQVVESGTYVLTSSIAGIVEKAEVIDGSTIQPGDTVLAITSNGLHTNGYSLIRLLMEKRSQIRHDKIENETFLEQIMKPHTPYYKAIKGLFGENLINGMAHITGGGIKGNLCRVIPDGMSAVIHLEKIEILPIFKYIKEIGNISDSEMLSIFNCGVGFILVVPNEKKKLVMTHINQYYHCYEIGNIKNGNEKVVFKNRIDWIHLKQN